MDQKQEPDVAHVRLAAWNADPVGMFALFIRDPVFLRLGRGRTKSNPGGQRETPIRDSSAAMYVHMFGRFARWIGTVPVQLTDVNKMQIRAFLNECGSNAQGEQVRERNSRIRMRYIRLLERVYRFLKVESNPAQAAAFEIFDTDLSEAGRDAAMVALSQGDVDRFMAALPGAPPGDADGWRKRRDAAMQALALGAGVKVAEVIGMYVENIGEPDKDGYVTVQISPAASDGASEWHDSRLEPIAVPAVLAWVAERNRMAMPGKLLFPATLSGKRMAKSTFYLAVKATFDRADLEVRHQGGRTLRNTFAVRALRRGVSYEDVNSCLGLRQPKSIEQYQYAAITQAAQERASSGSALAA